MLEHLKSLPAVVILTVLIWLVADRYVQEEKGFLIDLRVVSGTPDQYVTIASNQRQVTVQFKVLGRRRHIDAFNSLTLSRKYFEAELDPSHRPADQPQMLDTYELLESVRRSLAPQLFIEPQSVQPPMTPVLIDVYTKLRAAVQPQFGSLAVEEVKVSPPQVDVKLPRSQVPILLADGVIRPNVERAVRESLDKGAGTTQFSVTAALNLDGDPAMKIDLTPDEVTVKGVSSGSIEDSIVTLPKGPIQVTFSIPPELQKDYVVIPEGGDFRPTINLTGPREALLEMELSEIRAFVDVYAGDKDDAGRVIVRAVRFVLPPGLSLSADGPVQAVRFRIEPRARGMPDVGSATPRALFPVVPLAQCVPRAGVSRAADRSIG